MSVDSKGKANKRNTTIISYTQAIQMIKKRTFSNCYLIYGDEEYLLQHLVNSITEAVLHESSKELDCRTVDFQSKTSQIPFADLAFELQTPSFFSERRVLILQNTGLFSQGAAVYVDQLELLLQALSNYSILIIIEAKIDKRNKKSLAAIQEYAQVVECNKIELSNLMKWVQAFLGQHKIRIQNDACESLVERCERSMFLIRNELQKLQLVYRGVDNPLITISDLDEICIADIRGSIFNMTDAIATKNADLTLKLYKHLLDQKNAPQYILFMIARHFRQLIVAQNSQSIQSLMTSLKIGKFVADKLWRQRSSISKSQSLSIYNMCSETDYGIKSGKINEDLGIELLILRALEPTNAL